MQRKEKLNEIRTILKNYNELIYILKTPDDLDRFINGETSGILSEDNDYRKLKLEDILIIEKIEKQLECKAINEQQANILEKSYYTYMKLEYEKSKILYDNLLNGTNKEIPEVIELKMKELEKLFKNYGIILNENYKKLIHRKDTN